jgi:hypothetical protein
LEEWKDTVWQKARARGVHVPVAVASLAGNVEPLRHLEIEVIFRASHCDIKQPPLLFDFLRGASTEIRRDAAVNNIQHED